MGLEAVLSPHFLSQAACSELYLSMPHWLGVARALAPAQGGGSEQPTHTRNTEGWEGGATLELEMTA